MKDHSTAPSSPLARPRTRRLLALVAGAAALCTQFSTATTQEPPDGPFGGPGGPGGFGGPGGPGGPASAREQKIVERFDADKNGRLDRDERQAARQWLKEQPQRGPGGRGGRGGPGGPGGFPAGFPGGPGGRDAEEAATEKREPVQIASTDVTDYPDRPLYDQAIVRTIFLQFEDQDWFAELSDFYRTDVEVPATMRVDGVEYKDVGAGFRGNSSYFGVQGKKKSFSLSLDAVNDEQTLYGFKELNLLNCNDDPSYLREAIHAYVARQFTPALQANVVQLVVNGENWGLYANVQQFDKTFLEAEYGTKKGVRFKIPANPRGGAGLAYTGEDVATYERAYELKGKVDDEKGAFRRLIAVCKALAEPDLATLERELPAVLDVDAALWFLAIDACMLDGDGYQSRASDFLLWEGPDHRFRPLPYDSNEILGAGMRGMRGGPGGPMGRGAPPNAGGGAGDPAEGGRRGGRGGRGGGPGGGPGGMMGAPSPTSSPLALESQENRPLGRLLLVPRWRAAYLAHLRAIATQAMSKDTLHAFATGLHQQIRAMAQVDDKALSSFAAFEKSLESLLGTATTRQKALLEHASMQGEWPELSDLRAEVVRHEDDEAKLTVRVRVGGTKDLQNVWLHVAMSRRGPFAAVALHDDGQHGDGAANDGVFGGSSEPFAQKETVHYYLEALGKGDTPHAAFLPAASGRPLRGELDGKQR
ncbi:MAG: CotH kinase family protein [Planctomycetota bacterium]